MRLALDAMGGDNGPAPNVGGALLAMSASPDLSVVLVGDRAVLDPLLEAAGPYPADRLEVFHASQAVDMREKPVDALRKKPDSSIARAWQLLAEKTRGDLPRLGELAAKVSPASIELIAAMMAHDPAARVGSYEELLQRIDLLPLSSPAPAGLAEAKTRLDEAAHRSVERLDKIAVGRGGSWGRCDRVSALRLAGTAGLAGDHRVVRDRPRASEPPRRVALPKQIKEEKDLEPYERLFANTAYWKRIGEQFQNPLIVTGTVLFSPHTRSGYVQRDQEMYDSFGRRQVRPISTYMERKGFILRPKFVFIDGRTGATMYSESYREEILYNAQQNTPALSSYFELMDRMVPNFLSALSSQKIKGTRVLLK